MKILLRRAKKPGYERISAEVLSLCLRPYTPFYNVRIEWPDGERETIMMADEGLDKLCPDWRKFRLEQMTAPRGSR
jgi:hypothetical protein